MRKQAWYFKFGYSILGVVITRARWNGRIYDPENLPQYVHAALGIPDHKPHTRAKLYPYLSMYEGELSLEDKFPKYWRWNKILVQPI